MKTFKSLMLGLTVIGVAVAPILSGCAVDADDDPDTIVTPGGPSKTEVEVKPPDVNVAPPATTTTTTTGG